MGAIKEKKQHSLTLTDAAEEIIRAFKKNKLFICLILQ